MVIGRAYEITARHFDKLYERGLDVTESGIRFWFHFAFKQDVFPQDNDRVCKRIARRLMKTRYARQNRAGAMLCAPAYNDYELLADYSREE